MLDIAKLLAVSLPPDDQTEWLSAAEEGVDYLIDLTAEDETILFTNVGQSFVVSVFAPRTQVTPADRDDLLRARIMPESSWSMTYSISGDTFDYFLSPPLDSPGCNSLVGGEQPVIRRRFESVDQGATRTEISQKLVHALGLYWLDEQRAFCRLDGEGDVEPVIRVLDMSKHSGAKSDILVTINSRDLARYLAVTDTALVQRFDFTRFRTGSFTAWAQSGETKSRGSDLFYNVTKQPSASYASGIMVTRPKFTREDLTKDARAEWENTNKQYASFIAYDWKNQRVEEISCAPEALASYFETDSQLPFQISPAFFRPDVLQRYKADPEKYTLDQRSITSRAGWSLKTYDINDVGQVHTYLHYLGELPYNEQLYWKAFNEYPKSSISSRAYTTDIQGEWTEISDPLADIIAEVRQLDRKPPAWWQPRGEKVCVTVHYPVTTSPDEWANSLLALDQLLIEGFLQKPIRQILDHLEQPYDKNWQSLRLLQSVLETRGFASGDAAGELEPLKQLHYLRSKVKGHASGSLREELIQVARTDHGSLKAHFTDLANRCHVAFERVRSALGQR